MLISAAILSTVMIGGTMLGVIEAHAFGGGVRSGISLPSIDRSFRAMADYISSNETPSGFPARKGFFCK
jgi:hypothetical protein